jgi:hypothetical protein
MIHRSRTHLATAQEGYLEHFAFAATVGLMAIAAGLACLIHAIVPGLCTRTASRTIEQINRLLADRDKAGEIRGQAIDAIAFAALFVSAAIIATGLAIATVPAQLVLMYGLVAFALPIALLASNPELESQPVS